VAGGSGVKTNEREGTRAVAKYIRISPYKVREVLDIIRGEHVLRAAEILRFSERDAALVVGKVLTSAVANATTNDGLDPDDLYVSTAYADEGTTLKRFKPRARGRPGRIRKRTCHITIIVTRMPDEQLRRYRAKQQAEAADRRTRRVAAGRAGQGNAEEGGRGGRFRRGRGRDAASTAPVAVELDESTDDELIADEIESEELIEDDMAGEVADAGEAAEATDATDAAAAETTDEEPAEHQPEATPEEQK
jgi:large subunit ribosomal protein L22